MKELINLKNRKDEFVDFEEFKEGCKSLASKWALDRLADPNTIYIDTETTGLPRGDSMPEIIQISLINWKGQPLFSAMLRPEGVIPYQSTKIHGIENKDVNNCPSMGDLIDIISYLLLDKTLVAYNAAFDIKILTHWLRYYFKKNKNVFWDSNFFPECLMEYYSAWVGEWRSTKKDFKWQKLPKLGVGKAHDALVDAQSCLELVKIMASKVNDNEDLISLDF